MEPIHEFTSHVHGKNAKVLVFPDRIEWSHAGKARVGLAVATMGASAAVPSLRRKGAAVEVIPIRAVSSVTLRKKNLVNSTVSIIAAGNTVEVNIGHNEAAQLKDAILRLIDGQA